MLDFFRYFPLALRKSNNKEISKGPFCSKLRAQKWMFGDNTVSLAVPWSNSVWGKGRHRHTVTEKKSPGSCDILSSFSLRQESGDLLSRWEYRKFFSREWLFVAPWFAGYRSRLVLYAGIIGQPTRDEFNGTSFFHPRVFDSVLADYLNSYYGHKKTGRNARYRGPLNWRSINISEKVQGVVFDIHHVGNTSRENPDLLQHVFFPVTDNRLVEMVFDFGGTSIVRNPEQSKPMLELVDSIISTLKVNLGSSTQAQFDEVKKICPDMSLTKEFGELKWPIKPEDLGKPHPLPAEAKISDKIGSFPMQ